MINNFSKKTILLSLNRICDQIFALLPAREENRNWIKPLDTILIEIIGLNSLISDQKDIFILVCKLKGLQESGEDVDFFLFRRTIFECCSLVNQVKDYVNTNFS